MGNPPVKGWFVVNALGHCIFSGLKRVRLRVVSKVLPGCGSILPLAAHLPTNGTAFHVGPSIWSDNSLVRRSNCSVKSSMANNQVKENILVPIWVALRIHCLSNQVCIQYSLITIIKCEYVLTRVKDGVGVGQSNWVTVFVPFAGSDATLNQSSPTRDRNLCTEVVVHHRWGILMVAVVRVKVMVIVIKVIVRDQVSCWKVLFHSIGSKVVSNALIEYPGWIGQWISLLFRCHMFDLQTVCPFVLRMFAVKAEPTLVAGPKYHSKVNLTSENAGTLSLNITQSYQPNSHM
jgi:hypothetical protein